MRDLAALGLAAEPALRAALRAGADLETSRRLEMLIDALDACAYPADHVRALRALTVLELIGSPESTEALTKLSRQGPPSWVTQEAGATLRPGYGDKR